MTRMRSVEAAVLILEKEGATQAFGLPGAAINPFYRAMKDHGGIHHILARHVEAASHMAEGYTRAKAGNIGICVGTSGPAGTDMITGLYAAIADSIPILCITGQAPVAKLHKEDFQAVDIASIAAPVSKWAVTVLEPAQVPGTFQKAFQLMRSGRPGPVLIDLPIDVQLAEIEFDIETYEPLPVAKPTDHPRPGREDPHHAHRGGAPAPRRRRRHHQRRRGGPARRAGRGHRRPGRPDPDGLGHDPRRPPAERRHGRPADVAPLRQRDHARVRLRPRHRQPLGQPAYRRGRHLHQGPHLRAHRHRADPDRSRVRAGLLGGVRRRRGPRDARRGGQGVEGRRPHPRLRRLGQVVPAAQGDDAAQDVVRRRADQAAARLPGDEQGVRPGHPLRLDHRALADPGGPAAPRVQAAALDQRRPGRAARLDPARGARGGHGRPRHHGRGAVR